MGSLCEYMGHLRDKWFNYYVRMRKTSPCTAMSIPHAAFCGDRTQWGQAPTTVGGTPAS